MASLCEFAQLKYSMTDEEMDVSEGSTWGSGRDELVTKIYEHLKGRKGSVEWRQERGKGEWGVVVKRAVLIPIPLSVLIRIKN